MTATPWLVMEEGQLYADGQLIPAHNVESGVVPEDFVGQFRLENGLSADITYEPSAVSPGLGPVMMTLFLREGDTSYPAVIHAASTTLRRKLGFDTSSVPEDEAWIVDDGLHRYGISNEATIFPSSRAEVMEALARWSGLTIVDKRSRR